MQEKDGSHSVHSLTIDIEAKGIVHNCVLVDNVASLRQVISTRSGDEILILCGDSGILRRRLCETGALRSEVHLKHREAASLMRWNDRLHHQRLDSCGIFLSESFRATLSGNLHSTEALAELAGRGLLVFEPLQSVLLQLIREFKHQNLLTEEERSEYQSELMSQNDVSKLYYTGCWLLELAQKRLSTPWDTLASFLDRYCEQYRDMFAPLALATKSDDDSHDAAELDLTVVASRCGLSSLYESASQQHELCIDDGKECISQDTIEAVQEQFSAPELFIVKQRIWNGDSSRAVIEDCADAIDGTLKRGNLEHAETLSDSEHEHLISGNKRARHLLLRVNNSTSLRKGCDVKGVLMRSLEKMKCSTRPYEQMQTDVENEGFGSDTVLANVIVAGDMLRHAMDEAFAVAIVAAIAQRRFCDGELASSIQSACVHCYAFLERLCVADAALCSVNFEESQKRERRDGLQRLQFLSYPTALQDAQDTVVSQPRAIAGPSGCRLDKAGHNANALYLEAMCLENDGNEGDYLSNLGEKLWRRGLTQAASRLLALFVHQPDAGCEANTSSHNSPIRSAPKWASSAFLYGLLSMDNFEESVDNRSTALLRLLDTSCCASSMKGWLRVLDRSCDADTSKPLLGHYEELLAMRANARNRNKWSRELALAALSRMDPEGEERERVRWRLFNLASHRQDGTSEALAHLTQLGQAHSGEGMERLANVIMERGNWHELSQLPICGMCRHLHRSLRIQASLADVDQTGRRVCEAIHAILISRGQHHDAARIMLLFAKRLSKKLVQSSFSSQEAHITIATACMLSAQSLRLLSIASAWLLDDNSIVWPSQLEREFDASCARAILCAENNRGWKPSQLGVPLGVPLCSSQSETTRPRFGFSHEAENEKGDTMMLQHNNEISMVKDRRSGQDVPFAELASRLAELRHFGPAMRCANREVDVSASSSAKRAICKSLAAVAGALLVTTALGRYDEADDLARPPAKLNGPLGPYPLGEPRTPTSAADAFYQLRVLIDEDGSSAIGLAEAAAESLHAHGAGRLGIPDWLRERMVK
jgi:hypothetical protein